MCLYPKLIFNQKYKSNKKNGGIIPPVLDERTLYVPVGCGNCIECMKQKSRQWQIRLHEDIKVYKDYHMLTLTFDEYYLNKFTKELKNKVPNKILENEIATRAIRLFLERWRKHFKKSARHFLITELGHKNTERLHIHGLFHTTMPNVISDFWQYGIVHIGKYVNNKTINYIVKYITKIDTDHKGYKPKILCSSGLGSNYINKFNKFKHRYNGKHTIEYYQTPISKIQLPIYYRNKLFTEEEREKLWINLLDKNIRYVMGEKINISNNENEYYKTLKFYQNKNQRLGYGNDSKDWSIKSYNAERNNLKQYIRSAH